MWHIWVTVSLPEADGWRRLCNATAHSLVPGTEQRETGREKITSQLKNNDAKDGEDEECQQYGKGNNRCCLLLAASWLRRDTFMPLEKICVYILCIGQFPFTQISALHLPCTFPLRRGQAGAPLSIRTRPWRAVCLQSGLCGHALLALTALNHSDVFRCLEMSSPNITFTFCAFIHAKKEHELLFSLNSLLW